MLAPWKESYDKPRQHIKKQRHHFSDKGSYSQSYGSSSSHIWMWKLHHKKRVSAEKLMLLTVVLEKTLESSLDWKIKLVHPKGNQLSIFIWRTDAEAEAPILWPPDSKSWLTRKEPDAGKVWRQKERATEDEMLDGIRLNGHKLE